MVARLRGLVMGLCVAIYTGCLLGVCQGFPLWNSALLPILFLVSAVSTGMAAVLLVGVFYAPDEFNEVVVMKKFHFWLPVIEFVLVAALLFITAFNPSPAGWESVMSLVAGNWAVAFWLLFVIVGLVLPTILECWMLWLAKHEFETSRTGQMISALSDAGVLVGGFMLRLLIVSAAVPITIIQPWML